MQRGELTRADGTVAAVFVVAAVVEAVVLHRETPGLVLLGVLGAPLLAVLAVRRTRPAVPIAVICVFAAVGTSVQQLLWPGAGDGGGVWLFAMLFASYSLGAHGRGLVVTLGGFLPFSAALAIDLPAMRGWPLVSGVLFLTTFVGVLPTAVGHVVRVRRERLLALDERARRIRQEMKAQREAAVLDERLRTTERLRPALLEGLGVLAERAEAGADPGEIEHAARDLLRRTREEVVALTAPVDLPDPASPRAEDHLRLLRATAQRWTVLAAGAIGAGMALEATEALRLSAPAWSAVLVGLAVALPLAFVWWRPLPAIASAWCVAVAFSRLVAPLDDSLSGAAFALTTAFLVAALATRRQAFAGLVVCLVGQVAGVGGTDPLGVTVIVVVFWLGGLVVNELSRLVEQGRTNNRVLAGHEEVARRRAVIEERLRLARDVHDQIGHSLTVVALQAGAARRLEPRDPAAARAMLPVIAAAARDGLDGMTADGDADLERLLERTRATGLRVTAEVADLEDPCDLDPRTRAVAYRVVQEGLTNVLRHAPGALTSVTAHRRGEAIRVTVRNSKAAEPAGPAGSGQGLAGLCHLVSACAGELRWDRGDDGGFELSAMLPATPLKEVSR